MINLEFVVFFVSVWLNLLACRLVFRAASAFWCADL
jgi:hypothetical protein